MCQTQFLSILLKGLQSLYCHMNKDYASLCNMNVVYCS